VHYTYIYIIVMLQNLHLPLCFFFKELFTNSLWLVKPNFMMAEFEDILTSEVYLKLAV